MRHLISAEDVSRELFYEIYDISCQVKKALREGRKKFSVLRGKCVVNLFFEPSTRTRMSFEVAMKRLGGEVLNMTTQEASSIAKGETLADTVRVVSKYADAIVIRHPLEGSARLAAEFSEVPVINAGDGAGQHPTQTLLDLYTIRKESRLEGLRIALLGDLKYSRTVHSLIKALTLFNAKIYLISPESLRLPEEFLEELKGDIEIANLEEVIGEIDVLYVTRIQKERIPDPQEYERLKGSYRITKKLLKKAKKDMILLHPLPRLDELEVSIDNTPHAAYFEQVNSAVPIRMTALAWSAGVL